MQLVNVSGTWRIGRATSALKRCGHVIRAVRLHVLICPVCTPYFFANSERVSSSRIASSATLALKSDACFFLFVILDHFFHHSIHLHKWSKIPRPPLTSCHFDQLWGAGFATRIDFVSENGRQAHPRSDDQIVFFQIWGIVLGLFNLIELAPDQTRDADQLDTGAMSLAQCFASTSQAG